MLLHCYNDATVECSSYAFKKRCQMQVHSSSRPSIYKYLLNWKLKNTKSWLKDELKFRNSFESCLKIYFK